MSSPRLTADSYREIVAGLRGQRITDIVYYVLTHGDDGRAVNRWDFGGWHEPTMGVELITDADRHYSAIWNNSFDTYGLEIFPEPMTKFLVSIGQPWGSVAVSVSDHPRWAGLIGKKLTAAAIRWAEAPFDPAVQLPVAVRFSSRQAAVWIAVGTADHGSGRSFCLGTDDVMVVFTSEVATQAGIPETR